MSQACYAESCTNPVIGQCLQGYKGSCGRFYCHQHQNDGLCGICNDKKLYDEEKRLHDIELKKIINKYTELAEKIEKRPPITSDDVVGVILLCSSLFAPVFFLDIVERIPVFATMPNIVTLGIAVGIFIMLFLLFFGHVTRKKIKNKTILLQKIDEITKENPGFDEFYEIWKKHKNKKNKEELRSMALNTLGFSAKLAGGVITQAHKENKKLGIDILK